MNLKRYEYWVGGTVLGLAILVGLFFGIKAIVHQVTMERPHFSSGEIVQRHDDPAHYDDWIEQRWIGQTCSGSGSNQTCTQLYMPVFHHDFVPEAWSIQIENCHVNHKDGSPWMTKQGTNKCFKKWIDVDGSTYNSKAARMGVTWNAT